MIKTKYTKLILTLVGIYYSLLNIIDPKNKNHYSEYIEGAHDGIKNIPLNVTYEFDLITNDGKFLITQNGNKIIAREITTYRIQNDTLYKV